MSQAKKQNAPPEETANIGRDEPTRVAQRQDDVGTSIVKLDLSGKPIENGTTPGSKVDVNAFFDSATVVRTTVSKMPLDDQSPQPDDLTPLPDELTPTEHGDDDAGLVPGQKRASIHMPFDELTPIPEPRKPTQPPVPAPKAASLPPPMPLKEDSQAAAKTQNKPAQKKKIQEQTITNVGAKEPTYASFELTDKGIKAASIGAAHPDLVHMEGTMADITGHDSGLSAKLDQIRYFLDGLPTPLKIGVMVVVVVFSYAYFGFDKATPPESDVDKKVALKNPGIKPSAKRAQLPPIKKVEVEQPKIEPSTSMFNSSLSINARNATTRSKAEFFSVLDQRIQETKAHAPQY